MNAIRTSAILPLAALGLATLGLSATPASALSNRAWVSGHGVDAAGCGSVASPCRSFQYVHDNIVAAGGEIDVLDPAGYGPVLITKALSIVNDRVGTAGVQNGEGGGTGVYVYAGSTDAVHLRGLNIDGLGVAEVGIRFRSGASLDIVNCVVRRFFIGFDVEPTTASKFSITDSIVSDNFFGINVYPFASTSGTIKRVTANNNNNGFSLVASGAPSNTTVFVSVVDSVASNGVYGFDSGSIPGGATATLALENVTATGNSSAGIATYGTGVIRLEHSVIAGSPLGAQINGGGVIYSLGDNSLNANGTPVSGGSLTADAAK